MNPCILLQCNRPQPLVKPFDDYAKKLNLPLWVVDYHNAGLPYDFKIENLVIDRSENGPVLVYGSLDFIKACEQSPHLAPYIFKDRAAFSADIWHANCQEMMLNHDGCKMTVKEILSKWPAGDLAKHHIRPLSEDKEFNAGVFTWARWFNSSKELNLPDTLECWVSSDKGVLKQEWRCWIIDGVLVSAVQYKEDGESYMHSTVPPKVWNFAHQFAGHVGLHPARMFVMDLCLNANDEVKIVEFNSINSTGRFCPSAIDTIIERWLAALVNSELKNT